MKLKRFLIIGRKLRKTYILIVKDLWQAYYQKLGIHKTKCKHRNDNKRWETYGIKYKD